MADVRFVTLDPGHFHAALVQKEMYPGVSRVVHVYAPLGPDLIDHLARVSRFNQRADNPTSWELQVHATPDFLPQMLRDRAGNAVVLSGRNRGKIDRVQSSLEAGFNALLSAYPPHLHSVRTRVMRHLRGLDLVAFATAMERIAAEVP